MRRVGLIAVLFLATAAPAAAAVPGDPLLPYEWWLPAMHVTTAWDVLDQWRPVTVAVVDSGVDTASPDLRGALWVNPREIPGNGIDDDHNGFVDDVHGWDFTNNDADIADHSGHGTAVASVVAAGANNGYGTAGIAWTARILALKVVDSAGGVSQDAVAAAIRYAIANGAQVINLSLALNARSTEVEQAIEDAGAAGIPVVTAAGNDGISLALQPLYPASYPEPNVLAVASTTRFGTLDVESNRGPGVDIAAPGVHVLAPLPGGDWDNWRGTSFAAAQVTGALALLASGCEASGSALRVALLAGADRVPGEPPRVDLTGALSQLGRACARPGRALAKPLRSRRLARR